MHQSPQHPIAALFCGTLAGSLSFGTILMIMDAKISAVFLVISVFAFPVFLVGTMLFGAPLWIVLHRLGFRRLYHALLLGFILGYFVQFGISTDGFGIFMRPDPPGMHSSSGGSDGMLWIDGVLTPLGWRSAAVSALSVAFSCAIAGATVWWIAYRRKR